MRLRLEPEDIEAIASAVVEKLKAGDMPGWVDQAGSSLGRRRHINAVRRRMQSGKGGAVQIGRRYLLSQAALAEEMGRAAEPQSNDTTEDDIAAELGLRLN